MKCISTATVVLLCGSAVFFDRFGASADSRTRGHRGAASSETRIDTRDDEGDGGIAGSVGPDLIAGAITNFASYGSTTVAGETVMGYLFGATACNIGDEPVDWYAAPDNRHPYIVPNIYRIRNGRITQIGLGWGRHGFVALQQVLCSACTAAPQMTQLGVGCASPDAATIDGQTSGLGARSEVNAATGSFPGTYNAGMPPAAAVIGRRIQLKANDLNPSLNAGAIYLAEAQYIHFADAARGNDNNNASWRAFTVGALQGSVYTLTLAGQTNQQQPAIAAWRATDSAVTLVNSDVPADGRFILGYKVSQNQDGTWRYEYAVQNLNSDRSGRSFEVPLPAGATAANAGFSDIAYHSGDPYDSVDWSITTTGGSVRWTGPLFATNPNGNALRFATLYNFWFDSNTGPVTGSVSLGLFKPGGTGAPAAMSIAAQVPAAPANPADLNGDGTVNAADLAALLGNWNGSGAGDLDGNGVVGAADLAALLGAWS